jgi:hypothetical protein
VADSKRRDFEAQLASLTGRSIRAVTYRDLETSAATSQAFDSLDFGLTLHLDDGSDFSFTWGDEMLAYGVSARRGRLDAGRGREAGPRWQRLLGLRIRGVSVTWQSEGDVVYPQTVRLELESGAPVIVSAFELKGGDEAGIARTDHITVFFSDEDAARLDA